MAHCSAGCGRSGTFIGIDRILQDLTVAEDIDIYGIVCQLRQSRCNMVQTEAQYSLLYQIVNKILQGEFTDLPTALIENVILNIERAAQEEEMARSRSQDNNVGNAHNPVLPGITENGDVNGVIERQGSRGKGDNNPARRKSSRNSRIDSSDSDEDNGRRETVEEVDNTTDTRGRSKTRSRSKDDDDRTLFSTERL